MPGSGDRGGRGCLTSSYFSTPIGILLLLSSLGWSSAADPVVEPDPGPPGVTLRTLVTGSCLELQRYAESVVGSGVIRSTGEVQRGHPPFLHSSILQTPSHCL